MSVFKCIVNYFKKNFFQLILLLLIIISLVWLTLLPPLILSYIGDNLLATENYDRLLLFAVLYVSAFAGISLFNFFKQVSLVHVSQSITEKIRLEMIKKLHKISFKKYGQLGIGDLENYFNSDVSRIDELITSGVISMIIDAFKIIGIIVSVYLLGVYFGITVTLMFPLLILITVLIRKKMLASQMKSRKLEAAVNGDVYQSVNNIKTIKTYRAENFVTEKYLDKIKKLYKETFKTNFYDSVFGPLMQIVKYVFIASIIILSTYNQNIFNASVGTILGLIELIASIFTPIESLGTELQTLQKSVSAVKRIDEYFLFEEDSKNYEKNLNRTEEICLREVNFSYGKNQVLNNFNLTIKKGSRLVILGDSGKGKSTIIKLIMGLIRPDNGVVSVYSNNPFLLDEEMRRKYFTCLFQDVYFFGGTVKEEISLYDEEISNNKIYYALKTVGLSDRIKDINDKLLPNDFSDGEKVLINLARVVASQGKIIILDELNSKLDPLTASNVVQVIDEISVNKTVISISHFGQSLKGSNFITLE